MNDVPRQYTWHINGNRLGLTDVGLPNDLVLALISAQRRCLLFQRPLNYLKALQGLRGQPCQPDREAKCWSSAPRECR